MGLVYLATSPSGKHYVGQTTKPTAMLRWVEHVSEANGARDFSWLLNRAIRKHGGDKFGLMVLWKCSVEDLDEWEEYFIEVFNSRAPFGYNLSKGGKNGFQYTEEVRSKMSNSQRKHQFDENRPLPPHMFFYPEKGFAIRPPGKRIKYFRDPEETMDSKYEQALEALKKPELLSNYTPTAKPARPKKPRAEWNLGKHRQSEESVGLPRYITYLSAKDIIKVQKPGYSVKAFGNKEVSLDERKRLAIEYLNSLDS
jgi:group I intron endonuclease